MAINLLPKWGRPTGQKIGANHRLIFGPFRADFRPTHRPICSEEFQSPSLDASTSSCRQPSQASDDRMSGAYFGPRSHTSSLSLSATRFNPSAGYKLSWISFFLSHKKPAYLVWINSLTWREVCSRWFNRHYGKDQRFPELHRRLARFHMGLDSIEAPRVLPWTLGSGIKTLARWSFSLDS